MDVWRLERAGRRHGEFDYISRAVKLTMTNGASEKRFTRSGISRMVRSITTRGKDGNPKTDADNVTAKGDNITRNPDTGVVTRS